MTQKNDDRVFYQAVVKNENLDQRVPITFAVSLTESLISAPKNYNVTVTDFSIPATSIPINVVRVLEVGDGNVLGDVNLLDIGFSMTHVASGDDYGGFVTWVSPDATIPVPNNSVLLATGSQPVSPYYYNYTFQWLINLMNAQLQTIFNQMSLAHPVAGAVAPYFIYDGIEGRISLVATAAGWGQNPPLYTLQCNRSALGYLLGFPGTNIGDLNSLQNDYFRFLIINTHNNSYNPSDRVPASPPLFYRMEQEAYFLDYWFTVQNIVITTNEISVSPEYQNFSTDNGQIKMSYQLGSHYPSDSNPRGVLVYQPSEYQHLIQLNSSDRQTRMDMTAWWSDHMGDLYPIYVPYMSSATIRLMFIKRNL